MKLILRALISLLSHRLLLPVVCGLFLLLYIGIAFFTDEALVTLVQLIGHNPLALGLLALVATNQGVLMVIDIRNSRSAGKFASGQLSSGVDGICQVSITVTGRLDASEATRILRAEGYRVTMGEGFVAARRGLSLLCPRLLWRFSVCLLFAGVGLSLSLRQSERLPVIEGELLELPGTAPRSVERIELEDAPKHWFLQRKLAITMAAPGGGRDNYGIYPPGLFGSRFLYPRYLAVAPELRIAEPGIGVSEGFQLIMLYPPGREDTVTLSGDYRLKLAIPPREGMTDPFVSGRFDLLVKVLKGDQLLFEGSVPFGGRFEAGGFAVELLDSRRYVVTDFVRDYGVPFIWMACLAALLAVTIYLPIRLFGPYRFMVFAVAADSAQVVAGCNSEGGRRKNEALFYDLLDNICRNRLIIADMAKTGDNVPII